ncbi:hypothetical protein [Alcanivorax sp. DP30]|uniref:hypothetical protein n=1 Tax=Alcanivorax sp. DP30 TaxID=2606217 RepID=UPI00137021D4|nr:hypothetical protein [Alcanivorax sp. DP30]MZR61765.1 hypothetical protein [Alcanivorax sp. DP30]
MRLLLILTVIIAVIVLLLASWQRGKRVFAITAVLTAMVLAVLAYGVLKPGKHDQLTLPPDNIRVQVSDTIQSESGIRFSGTVFNGGELDLAGVTLRATAFACTDQGQDCRAIDQQEQLLQLYIPAGRHYAFAMVARHPEGAETVDKWEVTPVSRLAYPAP